MASNKMLIDASHPEETRVVVLRGNRIEEFDFESQNKQQLKGNIYLAKVTRVEPSLQAAFVDYGGNRHGFLAFSEIHPDYYQIPVADRQALLEAEAADARRDENDDGEDQIDSSSDSDENGENNERSLSEDDANEKDEEETAAESKPKRRQRRTRKKTSKSKIEAKTNEDAESPQPDPLSGTEDTPELEVAELDGAEEQKTEEISATKPRTRRTTRRKKATSSDADDVIMPVESEDTHAEMEMAEQSSDEAHNVSATPNENDGQDDVAQSNGEEADPNAEKPTSIAAMIETDSISEPAPDEDAGEEESADDGEQPEETPAARKKARSTRRPRKKAAVEESDQETEKSEADSQAIDTTEIDTSESVDPTSSQDTPAEVAEEVQSEELSAKEESKADEAEDEKKEEAAKPKSRRKRRSTRSRKDKAKDDETSVKVKGESANSDDTPVRTSADLAETNGDDDGEEVQSSGQEDALEEVPQRRYSRKQYKIQEVVKRRQVLLVQIVKEERGNKGAALTTYLSLAGRYSVLMPNTARGGGISRKITNTADRKRLKTIASELEVPEGMGVILRTAGASRTKEEIQRDFEYLMRLWENVRSLTLSSSAPCLVYEEGSLIKRSIRDLYDKNTGEVMVAGEAGYNEAKNFMTMLMPSHANKVSLYQDEQAMFARFGVEQQLEKMLSQQVTLKSGGYLVIDQTEALVAIDVNSGRATREHSIEDTALQTNLETAEEVARQLRLRDLAGLIVIDFIDMEEKRNNRAVEKKLKECLKHDRARIQVGRISHFGLLEMSRQRMRASVLDSTMEVCPHCQGKGHARSNSTVSLHLLRAIEEHLLKNSRFDLKIAVASDKASYILNHKRNALQEIEERFGVKIFIEGRHELLGENYNIEKGEQSTGERKPVNHIQVGQLSDVAVIDDEGENDSDKHNSEEPSGKRKRRRRRGRGNKEDDGVSSRQNDTEVASEENEPDNRRRQRGKRAGRGRKKQSDDMPVSEDVNDNVVDAEAVKEPVQAAEVQPPAIEQPDEEESKPAKRNRRPRKPKSASKASDPVDEEVKPVSEFVENSPETGVDGDGNTDAQDEPQRAKRRTTRRRPAPKKEEITVSNDQQDISKTDVTAAQNDKADLGEQTGIETTASDQSEVNEIPDTAADAKDSEKKRGGWWSRNGFFK